MKSLKKLRELKKLVKTNSWTNKDAGMWLLENFEIVRDILPAWLVDDILWADYRGDFVDPFCISIIGSQFKALIK